MPLIVISGFPSCGKTKRTLELKEYFEKEKDKVVHVVCENTLVNKDKNEVFGDSVKEKEIRGALKAEVLRLINREDVVILDAANYIKGYRYELYCASKLNKTPQCTINCVTPASQAWKWNLERPQEEQYTEEIFNSLIMRYEAPDSKNRWDSPMFTVLPEDSPPCLAIYEALYLSKAPKPNQSTQTQPLASTNFLYELERISQEVVTAILNAQKIMAEGEIKVPGSEEAVQVCRKLTLGELTRSKRQFITYTKMHPVSDINKIATLFVQYLNTSLA